MRIEWRRIDDGEDDRDQTWCAEVPGGWLFRHLKFAPGGIQCMVFVPQVEAGECIIEVEEQEESLPSS